MDPKKPHFDKREVERERKPDAHSRRDPGRAPESDDVHKPIEERERESELREHGELTEE